MYILTLLLLSVFTLYIAAFGFVRWDAAFLRAGDTPAVKALLILIGLILLVSALFLIRRKLKSCPEQTQKKLCTAAFFLLVIGQFAFLLYFRPTLRYDALKTFDQAVEMLSTHTISPTYEAGYFARYTNNYPITILTSFILSAASFLGVPAGGYMLTVQLINVLLLDISVLLGYQTLAELRGKESARFYMLLCLICPLTYVWSGFFYTSTLSMPFFMGALFLFQRLLRDPSCRRSVCIRRSCLIGVLLIMGYEFRATTMIALIAILIAALYLLRCDFRRLLTMLLSLIIACSLTLGLGSSASNHYVDFDYKNTGFPMIHWVMMGMRWDGMFDQTDEEYTGSFPTKEEKTAADKELLLERIREAGPGGLLSLMGRKLLTTWVDGTDTYEAEDSMCRQGRAYTYLLGSKDALPLIYSQIFRVLQMLSIGLGSLYLLLSRLRKKTKPDRLFLFQLTLLGCMAFHLLWEANPLYSIGFTFLALLLMADQMILLEQVLQPERPGNARIGIFLCSGSFILLLLFLILGKKQLVETPIEENLYRIHQYQYAGNDRTYVQDYDETYVQTFRTDEPFNRISLELINTVGPYNQSAFTVELKDENNQVLFFTDRFLPGMVTDQEWYAFDVGEIVPQGLTNYTLSICPGYIHDEDSLQILYFDTGNTDLYPGGSLSVAGKELKNGDLSFAVYEYQVTTYFELKIYLLLSALLLLCAGLITAAAGKHYFSSRT